MRSLVEFLIDKPQYIAHVVLAILGILIFFYALLFSLQYNENRRNELRIRQMDQCLGAGVPYDDCKFNVYGGLRISIDRTTDNSPPVTILDTSKDGEQPEEQK
jgi:hypothetical protein